MRFFSVPIGIAGSSINGKIAVSMAVGSISGSSP
jgi:hypothetical protein